MRAGCFAEKRVIDLLNRRFVPFYFNRGGPGKGHDKDAQKFTVGKTKNPYAYFAAFTPRGKYISETKIYADKDDVFRWLRKLLADHPEFAEPTEEESEVLRRKKRGDPGQALARARLFEEFGEYPQAVRAYHNLASKDPGGEDSVAAQLALLRIARYREQWKEHAKLEEALRVADKEKAHGPDLSMERAFRLLAEENYQAVRDLLSPLSKSATSSPRLAEIHFYTGVACWFLGDRDWAKFHWCWIVENLPKDRMYMRAYVAAAAEIMPYPNPELGGFKARGMIGTGHIVREVERSKEIYRKLKPKF